MRALLLWTCLVAAAMTPAAPGQAASSRVRILGTVQDGGLPHAACTCVRCEHERTSQDAPRYVASLAVITPDADRDRVYVIDATPDLPEQIHMLADVRKHERGRVDRAPLDGVFLTHAHMGHYLGLAHLGFEVVHTQDMPVYGSDSMCRFLRGNGPWDQLVSMGNIVPTPILPREAVTLAGDVRVEGIAVPHRDEYTNTLAFLIHGSAMTVLYVPDTDRWQSWDPSLPQVLEREGVDVALLDGTFFSMDELPGRNLENVPHPLIRTTMDLLQGWVDAKRGQVLFIHLNHSNPALLPDSAAAVEIVRRGFGVAREGREFILGP